MKLVPNTKSMALLFTITALTLGAFETTAFAKDSSCNENCSDRRIPYTPESDLQFIDFLAPHHQMAIEMADEELARGSSEEIKSMAKQMKEAQSEDIEILKNARKELTGDPNFKPFRDPHSDQDMEKMKNLSGEALDKSFLIHMIPHHASALSGVHRALHHLKRDDLKNLAKKNYHDQATEIGKMHEILDSLEK